jgi:CHAT domain-containing protein/tetratricopeptide (TPR) repeat protein
MITRRRTRVRVAALWIAACAVAIGVAHAQEAEDPLAAAREKVAEHRAAGEYAEAADAAREVVALLEADPEAQAYDVEDAGRTVTLMEHVAGLSDDQRHEFARGDSLTAGIVRLASEGLYAEGAVKAEERLAIHRRILGDVPYEITVSLEDLATLLQYSGDLDGAETFFRESLEIRRELQGDRHIDVGVSLNNFAMLLQAKGDLAGAEEHLGEAIDIIKGEFGDDDLDVATLTNNLGMLLYYQGDYDGAEPLYREALATRRAQLPADHPDVGTTLNNIAVLLYARCDYAAAEPVLREATAIWRKALGEDHPQVALSLSNLGALLNAQGETSQAVELHREALAIYRKTLGDEHPDVATALNNLALDLENLGDYGAAEPLLREALEISRNVHGNEHHNTASILNSLAHLLQTKGDYEEAEPLYREALDVRREVLGGSHLNVATSLSNLASLLEAQERYDDAEPLYREALEIRRELLGDQNAAVAHNLSSLGQVLLWRGDPARAEPILAEAAEMHDAACLLAGEGLKRATIALRLRPPSTALASARLAQGKADEAWPAAEKALARALADLLMTADERALSAAEVAREDSLKAALTAMESELAAYRAAAATDTTGEATRLTEEARQRLLETEAAWSAFRRGIASKYPVTEGQAFPLSRVQEALPADAALLGWIDVEAGGGSFDSWVYAVLSEGPVAWARCGDASSGSYRPFRESQNYREQLATPQSSPIGVGRDARGMWTDRVASIEDVIADVEELVVIPSGAMLGMPVETLADGDGVLLGDRFAVSYAPSATIYAWLRENAASGGEATGSGMLLLGDPPFTSAHLDAMESEGAGAAGSASGGVRSGTALDEGVGALAALPRLPGSRTEVALLSDLVPESTVLLGADASEQALVDLARTGSLSAFGTIHLATHALVDDQQPERSALVLSQVGLPDPLEAAISGERIYDGLLTAKEIVREWRMNADLVTLSACETGLGKEIVGEGYIGFAHAFLQAGTRSLLVSLWKVEDRATSLLMRRFYENRAGAYEDERAGRTGEPMTKAAALQEAKRWLRAYTDEEGRQPYDHPYYWSAFILIGERGQMR